MKNYIKILALSFVTLFSVTSCIKDDTAVLKDEGSTFIKINGGDTKAIFFSPFLDIRKVDLVDIRRDANSQASLNQPMTLIVRNAPELVDQYNEDNGSDYEQLPSDIYTLITDNGVSVDAQGNYSIALAAGEFAKNISINLDGSKWDLSKKYALGFELMELGGAKMAASKNKVIVTIAIKNKYDGSYEVTGTMVDNANPGLTHINDYLNAEGAGNWTPELRTLSATECIVYDPVIWGGYFIPISTDGGAGASGYGSFIPIFEFDPNTDEIVSAVNGYGQPAGNTRSAELDPSGVNKYDNGVIQLKYRMLQPSVIVDAPHIRTTWDETWTYIGPR